MQETYEYQYDFSTKEFLNKRLAIFDALENKYITTANATFIAPPATKSGEVACFDEQKSAWRLVKDYRGVKYWDKDGAEHLIEVLGEEPSECARFTPPPIIFNTEHAKQELTLSFKQQAAQLVNRVTREFNLNIMLFSYAQMPDAENNPFLKNMGQMQELSVKDYISQLLVKKANLEKLQLKIVEIKKEALEQIEDITGEFSFNEVKQKYDYKFKQLQEDFDDLGE